MRGFNSGVPYLRKLLDSNDIVIVTEHWLHSNRLSRFKEVAGDIAYSAKSSRFASSDNYGCARGQGGVAILWHNSFKGITDIKEITHDRITGVRIQTQCGGILNILGVYLPANGSPEQYAPCIDDLIEIYESREPGAAIIIGGDINGDMGTLIGSRSTRAPSERGRRFFEVVQRYNLVVCNMLDICTGPVDTFNGPTGSSTIDYICIPAMLFDKLCSCQVADNDPLNTSDHESVSVILSIDKLTHVHPGHGQKAHR